MTQGQLGLNIAKAGIFYWYLCLTFPEVIGAYKKVKERNDKRDLLYKYLNYGQAKIVLKAPTAEVLLTCYKTAERKGINFFLTEELDKKTEETIYPCLAIGPDVTSKIDLITGHLKLL